MVERAAVQSWSCGDDDARGGGAHGGGGAHSMGGTSAEAVMAGLVQDQYGVPSEYVAASDSESAYVAVAVVVELYNASAVVAVAAAAAAACAMRTPIPAPSAQFPLSRVHLARTWAR